jgi:hypothetical protein
MSKQNNLLIAAEKAAKAMGNLRGGCGKRGRKTIPMDTVFECTEEAIRELQAAIKEARK